MPSIIGGLKIINDAKQLAKTPANGGFVFGMPPLARILADQLEISLEEDQTQMVATALGSFAKAQNAQAVPTVDNTASLMEVINKQQAMIDQMMARFAVPEAPPVVTEQPKPAKAR